MQFNASLAAPVARETFEWMREDTQIFAIILGILIASGVGYDALATHYPDAFLLYQFVFLSINLTMQAWATLTILVRAGTVSPATRHWRIASLFGLGIVFGLGVGLGLLLLILPGVYFAARWYLAVPILLAEDMAVSEALSASWKRTEEYWLSCAIIAVLAFVWQIAPLGVGLAISLPVGGAAFWGATLATNILSQAGWLFGVAAATTFYLRFGKRLSNSAEIFG